MSADSKVQVTTRSWLNGPAAAALTGAPGSVLEVMKPVPVVSVAPMVLVVPVVELTAVTRAVPVRPMVVYCSRSDVEERHAALIFVLQEVAVQDSPAGVLDHAEVNFAGGDRRRAVEDAVPVTGLEVTIRVAGVRAELKAVVMVVRKSK